VNVRDWVEFSADFPDDAVWDSHDNLLVPGGKAIAEVLRDHLARRGFSCTSVRQHSFYGWCFYAGQSHAKCLGW